MHFWFQSSSRHEYHRNAWSCSRNVSFVTREEKSSVMINNIGYPFHKLFRMSWLEYKIILIKISRRPTTPVQNECVIDNLYKTPGRPAIQISCEMVENLRGLRFTGKKIAAKMRESRWSNFSSLTDEELDAKVSEYINRHGGNNWKILYKLLLMFPWPEVQWSRVQESIVRLDPKDSAIRWGCSSLTDEGIFCPWTSLVACWRLTDLEI